MPPIHFGPALPISAVDNRPIRTAPGGNVRAQKTASSSPGLVRSDALDPGAPPVDVERINLIRKAVEAGTYPIVPARVADAMIAAGLLLRSAR